MKIEIIAINKNENGYVNEGYNHFLQKLKHYVDVAWIFVNTNKTHIQPEQQLQLEAQALKPYLKNAFIVLLDENGKEYNSKAFAEFIDKQQQQSIKKIIFVIGGAFGFHNDVRILANTSISLSKMTFNHQLIRVVFLEQLYRAFTIIKNEKYHHE